MRFCTTCSCLERLRSKCPLNVREQAPEIEWRKIAGLRDVLAHGYFRIDLSIIRDVAYHKLDVVVAAVERLLAEV